MPTKMVYDFEARPISTLEEAAEATLRLAISFELGGGLVFTSMVNTSRAPTSEPTILRPAADSGR